MKKCFKCSLNQLLALRMILILLALVFSGTLFSQSEMRVPKNIILMISDGCGYNHIKATNYYQYGQDNVQVYEKFPVKVGMSTYPAKTMPLIKAQGYDTAKAWTSYSYLKSGYTCSSAAATAMATGVKTTNGYLGVDNDKKKIENLTEYAKAMQKAAGVVTSVQLSHATPAGFVAHNESRSNYSEIAKEMILKSKCDVIMGCGHPFYDDNAKQLPKAKSFKYVGDSLLWSQILQQGLPHTQTGGIIFSVADIDGDGKSDPWKLIEKPEEFAQYANGDTPKRIFGVAQAESTLQCNRDKSESEKMPFDTPLNTDVPKLTTMVAAALNVLDNNPNGFFLMIEGGAIDWASHDNNLVRLVEEEIDFNLTVEDVVKWIETNSSWDETLLIVTADHETGLIWGEPTEDKKEFVEIANNGKENLPTMQWNSDNHSNSLVPLFAKGAGAQVFNEFADETDPVRGKFITNTEIHKTIKALWTIK